VSVEPTGFLYPFIDSEERDSTSLVSDLAESARAKFSASRQLRAATLERCRDDLRRAGARMAERFRQGGRLFAFGNGGSATDAAGAVELFADPPFGRPLPAISLVDDQAVLTALANDIGFDVVFSRQIIAHARASDIAVGFSTSGDSVNVLRALEEAACRGVLTVGLSGYDGGAMASSGAVDHSLVVRCDSVHRIQESQNALLLELWTLVQDELSGGGDRP
jgi:D-sedoheptulose 7-phosphate isomerase